MVLQVIFLEKTKIIRHHEALTRPILLCMGNAAEISNYCNWSPTGAQPRVGIWGICPPPKFSKHCIAFLTFAEAFK